MNVKKNVFFLFLAAFALTSLQAAELDFFVDAFNFRDPSGKPFLEVHINVNGESLHFTKNASGKFQGTVEVLLFLEQGEGEKQAEALRIDLISPEISDTTEARKSLRIIDVRRLPVTREGVHSLTGILTDKNDPMKHKYEFEFEVNLVSGDSGIFGISDVLFVEIFQKSGEIKPWSKYGYDVLPRIQNDVFEDEDELKFYLEFYHTDKIAVGESYFVHSYITQANSEQKLAEYQQTIKKKSSSFDVYSGSFPISGLASQVYNLHIELYENGANLNSKTRRFYVLNNRISVDATVDPEIYEREFGFEPEELTAFLHPMKYIATQTEIDFMESLSSQQEKENFFTGFWLKRKVNAGDPVTMAFEKFKAKLDYVNDHYKAYNRPGWKTDRGRVMIQYGAPNHIDYFVMEAREYPHEIWRYNRVGTQFDAAFVFYDPDGIVSDFPLLHSDVRGENNNPRWRLELQRRTTDDALIDATGDKRDQGSGTRSESDRR